MAASRAEYLINDSKYSFLKELGLQESNLGVFDGTWKGSGQVKQFYLCYEIYNHLKLNRKQYN